LLIQLCSAVPGHAIISNGTNAPAGAKMYHLLRNWQRILQQDA
jgi:hypothetical protein